LKQWFVYLLECNDKTIYTGITNDIEARLKAHNEGKGAKYTRGRRPFNLLKTFSVANKSEALKMEREIKKLSRDQKLKLVDEDKMGKFNIDDLCSLAESEALISIKDSGLVGRVVERDGQGMVVTRDLKRNRVNLVLVEGKVSKAYFG
jgi:putative endonuclease